MGLVARHRPGDGQGVDAGPLPATKGFLDPSKATQWPVRYRRAPTGGSLVVPPPVGGRWPVAVGSSPPTVVGSGMVDAAAVASVAPPVVLAGAAFYSDGTTNRSGPSGTRISVFATSAEPDFTYRLVPGRSGPGSSVPCTADVVPVVDAVRFAGDTRFVAQSAGPLNLPPGQWQVCFRAAGRTVTGAATFTVTPGLVAQ